MLKYRFPSQECGTPLLSYATHDVALSTRRQLNLEAHLNRAGRRVPGLRHGRDLVLPCWSLVAPQTIASEIAAASLKRSSVVQNPRLSPLLSTRRPP